jgi:hypothetical protein
MPSQMRSLYAELIAFNGLKDPRALWDCFKSFMCEDFLHAARRTMPDRRSTTQLSTRHIARHLQQLNHTHTSKALDLPEPPAHALGAMVAEELARYPAAQQAALRDQRVPQLNPAQRTAYDRIMSAISQPTQAAAVFFVDGLGGAGKTFLYETLLCSVRAQPAVAIATASSGIAALLLSGGRTAHSRFKIPVKGLSNTSTCYITRDSELASSSERRA